MRRENTMARMLRALSGQAQEQAAEALDVHPSLIAQIELDEVAPSAGQLEKLALEAGLTVAGAEELLDYYGSLRRSGRWRGGGFEETLERMKASMLDHLTRSCEEMVRLRLAERAGPEAEWQRAEELWARLEKYPEAIQLELVEVADEYQNMALVDLLLDLSSVESDRDPERAAAMERVAEKIADLVVKSA